MNTTTLLDGTKVFCLNKPEAQVLDSHINGYFQHGISLADNDIVFDVGANIGIFGLRTMQRFPQTKVYAFEPIPFIHEVLAKNAEAFPNRFFTFPLGIGEKEGAFIFSYYPNSPALSTSHPEVWEENPQDLQQATYSQMQNLPPKFRFLRFMPRFFSFFIAKFMQMNVKKVSCKVVSLSEIMEQEKIERIDLLKIDCEGAEYDVLLGIRENHWGRIQKVVAEVYNHENRVEKMRDLLQNKGFSKIHIEEDEGVKGANLYNIFAIR
jgi:FkbM family methyltransferase